MAFIGKSKKSDDAPAAEAPPENSPQKAAKFFEHARTTQDTGNYDYAMQLWLRGMVFSPHDMNALEAFCSAALSFVAENGKKSPSKETSRAASGGKGPVHKYLPALLTWAIKPADTQNAVRVAEAAVNAELPAPAYWRSTRCGPTPSPRRTRPCAS